MGQFVNVIAVLMTIAGLGMAGHAIYRSNSSGQEIYASKLQSGSGPIKSFDIDLDPSMNPVSFGFSADMNQSYARHSVVNLRVNYWASLTLDRKPVLQRSVTFNVDRPEGADGKTTTLQFFAQSRSGFHWDDVAGSGRYRFAMAWQGGDQRAIQNIEVKVRRNVEDVKMKKVWWGLGLIVVAGLLEWLFGAPLPGSRND